jgi:hypothetical protein
MQKILPLMLVAGLSFSSALPQGAPSQAPAVTIYPSFHVKFAREGGNYLLASTVILNVSGYTVRDLTLTQSFPDELIPSPAPEATHEYFRRPDGYEESIEGQTYRMHVPLLRRRELTTSFVLLRYDGRPSKATVPAATVEYTVAGESEKRTQDGPFLDLDVRKYTRYSGSLSDFIKRYARMQLPIPEDGEADWGFSSFATRVRAKTPVGIVEIEGGADEGKFSLLSGAPGDAREMLVSWKPTKEARPAETEEQVRQLIKRQMFAGADFAMDLENASLEKKKLARGQAWVLDTRWTDGVADRLGGGPIRWYVYDDPEKKSRHVIMIRAQGRGAGPGKADVPNPEREAALMGELEKIVGRFRPY